MSRIQDIVLALAVTLVVIAARSIGLWGEDAPSLGSTYPLFLLVPALLGVPRILLALVYAGCFVLWSKQLLRGRADIPRRSLVLVISLLVSSYTFTTNWKDGITYQGTHYVCATFSLNLVVLLLLVISPAVASSHSESDSFCTVSFRAVCVALYLRYAVHGRGALVRVPNKALQATRRQSPCMSFASLTQRLSTIVRSRCGADGG
jgi:hypothetical protein